MSDRFYLEREVLGDDDDLVPEIMASAATFEDAVDWASENLVRKAWADAYNILIGDRDGPDERVARLERADVAENQAALRRYAEVVLTIEVPSRVPREWVEHAAGTEVTEAYGKHDSTYAVYVQLAPDVVAPDAVARRYQMMELTDRRRPAQRSEDEPDDPSTQRAGLLELNPTNGRIAQRAARANPPRLYRAQKVVAKLERAAAPAFPAKGMVVTNPDDLVRNTLAEYLGERAHESFLVLFLSVRNQVIGFTEFTSGSNSAVEVHVSGIMRDALAVNAAGLVTVHNHPTGDPTPSQDDERLWKRIRDAGTLMGVPVVDSLVVGEGGRYYSQSESER